MVESFSFTQRRVEQAPAPATGRAEYADTQQPKLRLRVSPNGHRTFILLHKDMTGRSRRVTLGTFPGMGVDAARKAAAKALGEFLSGGDPIAAKRTAKVQSATLASLVDRYLESRPLKDSTRADYRKRMALGFGDWTDGPASRITEALVLKRHKELTARGPTLANGCFRTLRAVLRYGVAVGALESDPVAVLSRARLWHPPKRRTRIIPNTRLGHWVRTVGAMPIKDRALLLLLLFSGLRIGEASGLRWEDVDLIRKTLVARDTKNHRDHELPIAEALLPHLRALQAATGRTPYYLFPTADGTSPLGPRYAIARAVKATGFEFSAHDLRRTFATIAEAAGLPVTVVKRLLNHVTDNDVTGGYIRTEMDTLRVAVNKIGSFIMARAEGGEVIHLAELRQGA